MDMNEQFVRIIDKKTRKNVRGKMKYVATVNPNRSTADTAKPIPKLAYVVTAVMIGAAKPHAVMTMNGTIFSMKPPLSNKHPAHSLIIPGSSFVRFFSGIH